MREINLDNVTEKDLFDYESIAAAFKKYLMEVFFYDESEADFVVSTDFENPYNTPFIMQDYEGQYTIGGKEYEVRSCRTDFCAVGLFHLASEPQFEFFMLFDLETLPDNSVRSYQNARKMYLF
jgi:hypothetical protein